MLKRITSTALALILAISLITFSAPTVTAATDGDYEYSVANGKATITKYTGSGGKVTIPGELGSAPVTAIGDAAFSACTALTAVTIPDSVTTIGKYAFYGCSELNSIVIPDSVTAVYESAFYNCFALTSAVIGSRVSRIGKAAFAYCYSLVMITFRGSLPKEFGDANKDVFQISFPSITLYHPADDTSWNGFSYPKISAVKPYTLGQEPAVEIKTDANWKYALLDTSSAVLKYSGKSAKAAIPDTLGGKAVTIVGNAAFSYSSTLTTVTVPDSVTTIGEYAFLSCTKLTSVVISNGVISIGGGAFYDSKALKSVTIPNSVTEIGLNAFFYWDTANGALAPLPNLTITCNSNSYAHTYAKNNNIPVKPADAKTYTVKFSKGNGTGSWDSLSRKAGETVTITKAVTQAFTRKEYVFSHFLGSDGKQHKAGAVISITSDLTLTAQYTKVSVNKGTTPKLSKESGKIRVRYDKVSNAAGYQFAVSTSKTFAAGKGGTKTYAGYQKNYIPSCAGKKLKSGTTYYVKIRAYKLDSTDNRVWGAYSAVTSIKF